MAVRGRMSSAARPIAPDIASQSPRTPAAAAVAAAAVEPQHRWTVTRPPQYKRAMTRIAFRKMHGLGNDFVVLDQRRDPYPIDAAAARALADRRTGIGCDQLLLLELP